MKQVLFIFFIILPAIVISQSKYDFDRLYSDTLPHAYNPDIDKLRDQIYNGIPDKYKKDIYECMSYVFADQTALEINIKISSGYVYSDWKELEEYINAVLKNILPEELRNDSTIHAYIVQDGNFNAEMTPSGHMFINIGVLGNVYNEAMLGGILAHEVAHYYLRHSLFNYIDYKTGVYDEGLFPISENKLASKYSIRDELQADSLSMKWVKNSGYNINGLKKVFEFMVILEENQLSRTHNYICYKDPTHPTPRQRMSKFNEFYKRYKDVGGEYFKVSEEKFNELKQKSKPEILKNLLNSFEYYQCIETAFKFHLYEPDNKTYIYYLLEGIRRQCYLNPHIWKERFITNRYYDSLKVKEKWTKTKMKENLFSKVNLRVLTMDEEEFEKIKTKSYWEDKPKFITYEQAYNAYFKVSMALRDYESILSNALSYNDDTLSRNKLLRLYLSKENIKHREYASNLLKGTIYSGLSDNKILVFNNLRTIIRLKDIDVKIRKHNPEIRDELSKIFDSIIKDNKTYKAVYLPGLKACHLNDYKMLSYMQLFCFMVIMSKGQKTELHILDPSFWETFKKFDVNEIVYLNSTFMEIGRNSRSLKVYKNTGNLDYNDVFSALNEPRYMNTYISCLRDIPNKYMKVHYYGGSVKLKPIKNGYTQIINEINYCLKRAEAVVKKYDKDY